MRRLFWAAVAASLAIFAYAIADLMRPILPIRLDTPRRTT